MNHIDIYHLYSNFLVWLKENNWVNEESGKFLLTPEGEEEMEALGINITDLLCQKEASSNSDTKEKIDASLKVFKKEISEIHIYTDGGARGNQNGGGPAAIGILLCDECDNLITTHKQYLGKATNNQAEYQALITALSFAKNYLPKKITCFSDSELMINQLNGTYKIKDAKLQKLVMQVKELENEFQKIEYIHVFRENRFIKKADKMVNQVLNAQSKKA